MWAENKQSFGGNTVPGWYQAGTDGASRASEDRGKRRILARRKDDLMTRRARVPENLRTKILWPAWFQKS